jgi:hypothetical protein
MQKGIRCQEKMVWEPHGIHSERLIRRLERLLSRVIRIASEECGKMSLSRGISRGSDLGRKIVLGIDQGMRIGLGLVPLIKLDLAMELQVIMTLVEIETMTGHGGKIIVIAINGHIPMTRSDEMTQIRNGSINSKMIQIEDLRLGIMTLITIEKGGKEGMGIGATLEVGREVSDLVLKECSFSILKKSGLQYLSLGDSSPNPRPEVLASSETKVLFGISRLCGYS